jgi:hypothetical protein
MLSFLFLSFLNLIGMFVVLAYLPFASLARVIYFFCFCPCSHFFKHVILIFMLVYVVLVIFFLFLFWERNERKDVYKDAIF